MENKTFRTPIEKIFFRSSKNGVLANGLDSFALTPVMIAEKKKLELLLTKPIGLSEKQQEELKGWNEKIEAGGSLAPKQMEKRDDYKERLIKPKGLTGTQSIKYQELQERESREPELTAGAKTFVKEVWLQNERGFKKDISSKYLSKGLEGEEDGIALISYVDGIMYIKNEKRVHKGHVSGECDVNHYFKDIDVRVIHDTKCSWDPVTFMAADLKMIYKWQGVDYLYLYDADVFKLRYCLVNCPPDTFAKEYKKFCFDKLIIDDTEEKYRPMLEQFFRNYIYDFDVFRSNRRYYPDTFFLYCDELEPMYTKEERVKTFELARDPELEKTLLKSVELALEYYKTITLNGSND